MNEKLYTLIEQNEPLWPRNHPGYQDPQAKIIVSLRAGSELEAVKLMEELLEYRNTAPNAQS